MRFSRAIAGAVTVFGANHLYRLVCFFAVVSMILVSSTFLFSGRTSSNAVRGAGASLDDAVSLQSAGRGNPWISMTDGHELHTAYEGPDDLVQLMARDQVQPLSLATADFDGDGMPDLIAGYAGAKSGVIMLLRGNVDSVYPNSQAARRRKAEGAFSDAPFLSPARIFEAAVQPDFLEAGDFNADGYADLVIASRSDNSIYLMRGDGGGTFKSPEAIVLAGKVTAMASGDVNRADGLVDLVVGVEGMSGNAISQNSNRGVFIDNTARNTIGGNPQAGGTNVISDATGNTSEFSSCLAVTNPNGARIASACKGDGKQLIINGSGFVDGAKVYINGDVEKKTQYVSSTQVIAFKAGKRVQTADTLKVRNPDATETPQITYARVDCSPGGTQTEELLTDDGTAELLANNVSLLLVNRRTPSSYPATLLRIRIDFRQLQGQPSPVGQRIRLVAFLDPSGSGRPPNFPALLVDQSVVVPQEGGFVDFPVVGPNIIAGDLYVGFQAPNPANGVFFSADTNGVQQQRAFQSTDNGLTFVGPVGFGSGSDFRFANFLIRAVVSKGG